MLMVLAPILVFGLVIFVHELGHFLAAKSLGVYAPRFSIGFGPALWKRRRGETEYVLAAFPLGGYVRMASRLDEEIAGLEGGSEEANQRAATDPDYDPEAMIPFGPKQIPAERLFESKPLWARLVILLAGVAMNFVLAMVVLTVLAAWHGRTIVSTRVVGAVEAPAAAPELAQLRRGDTITAVNGRPVASWNEIARGLAASGDTARLATTQGEVVVPLAGRDVGGTELAMAVRYFVPAVLDSVVPGSPAAGAGLRAGDSVVAIAGAPVGEWEDLTDAIGGAPGRSTEVVVMRGAERVAVTITPRQETVQDPETGEERTVGRIGVAPREPPTIRERVGPVDAVVTGARATGAMSGAVVGVLKRLFTGSVSVRQLGGPIAITRASVEAARSGLDQVFTLIAFLSINVAILNLLPVPILDGGQVLINTVESAKGSPFSLRTREYLMRIGLAAILLLFAVVMFNDTRVWLARALGWVTGLFG